MSEAFEALLNATIRHLEQLRDRGTRFVQVDPSTVAALSRPAPRSRAAKPAPPASPESRTAPTSASASRPRAASPAPAPPAPSPAATATQAEPFAREAKESAMATLRERAEACVKCPHLASSRKTVVFGVGDIHSPLLFVGEAPGADEDAQGEPFVGKAGQLLTRIINTMGFSRDSVYIANILKCRPDTPGQAAGNRKPTADEMKTCLPYLLEQIDIIRPQVMVALGATAVEGLFGKTIGITRLRGNWQTFRNIPVMPTYHPAFLLRNQSLAEKRRVWEDMLQVLERLGRPISEKQRGFFLRGAAEPT